MAVLPSLKIYVLRLENQKWYVGATPYVSKRYQEHRAGKGAVWTSIHKPIKIEKVVKNASPFDEDKITKEYMSIYGIDNVRGGSYCQEHLEDFQRESVQRELWMASGACFICGRKGHFSRACREDFDITGRLIGEVITIWLTCSVCGKSFSKYKDYPKHTSNAPSKIVTCDICKPAEIPLSSTSDTTSTRDIGSYTFTHEAYSINSDASAELSPRSMSDDSDLF